MVAAVPKMEVDTAAPMPQSAPGLAERLVQIRLAMDDIATRHCQAQQSGGRAVELSPVKSCITEAEAMLGRLSEADAGQANMIIGCGWHMLGDEERAFQPLMHVCKASYGSVAPQDQLSAIMTAMPMMKKRGMWAIIARMTDRAKAITGGTWAHFTLPYMKGIALAHLNRPTQAAELFEEAISMNPGWHAAYIEFDKAATALRDFERCRRMAQRLVDHGGYWVNCWQRPDHFLTEHVITSQPWYDAQTFGLARTLEEHFSVIKAEMDAWERAEYQWGRVGSSDRGNENSAHDSDLVTSGTWSEVVLLGDTGKCAGNCSRCPETARILRSCAEAAECAGMQLGESLFSRLRPGTCLRPHCGPTNMRLTCHLGLDVPAGCEITCGGETRTWQQGRCIVFDDSFEHEVKHHGDQPRTVLLVNFWHPDIPRDLRKVFIQRLRGEAKQQKRVAEVSQVEAAVEPYQELFSRVRAAGGYVSPKLIRGRAPPLNILGMLAAAAIQEGEVLCRIPARLHLSPPALRVLAPELWEAVAGSRELPGARRPEALQATFLCQLLQRAQRRGEASGDCSHTKAGDQLAALQKDPDVWNVWERYADVLLGEDFALHPYRRAAAEPGTLHRSLDPSPEAEFFTDMSKDLLALHQTAAGSCLEVLGEEPPSPELFLQARLCMLSRGFKTCHDSTLVPVVDLFNHAHGRGQGVSWHWDETTQAMVVTAKRAHEAGEELFCSYGPKSNLLLYRTYGFTHPPDVEPSWAYVVRPRHAASVYAKFLPQEVLSAHVVLDSNNVEESLCGVLNAVARGGEDAAEFLHSLCSCCKLPYDQSEGMKPLLDALHRARAKDPASAAWWSELEEAHQALVGEEGTRVKMCEYLCLVSHLEAIECARGNLDASECLKGTERLQDGLVDAFRVLQEEKRDIAVERVPGS